MHIAGFSASKSLVRGSFWLSITCTVDEEPHFPESSPLPCDCVSLSISLCLAKSGECMDELRTAESLKARVWEELWAAQEKCQDPRPLVSHSLEVLELTSAGEQHSLK